MAKSKQPTTTQATQVTLPSGNYQWQSCKQVIKFIKHDKAEKGFTFYFKYIESKTNLDQTLSLSSDNFERVVKFGSLIKIS